MIVDLFAGAGGWTTGARGLVDGPLRGIELDPPSAQTHRNVHGGPSVLEADARFTSPHRLVGEQWVEGLVASPPVQTFSRPGRGSALQDIPALGRALALMHEGVSMPEAIIRSALHKADERTLLAIEPMRWIQAFDENGRKLAWLALEHAPLALPVLQHYEVVLRDRGFATWTGVLNTRDFGVPQNRERAVLCASRLKAVGRPVSEAQPVTMREALRLSWLPAGAVLRPGSWTGTERGRPYAPVDGPSPTLAFGNDHSGWKWVVPDGSWAADLTIEQMAVLQGFPADYLWSGTKSQQAKQISNAIAPPMARAILQAVI